MSRRADILQPPKNLKMPKPLVKFSREEIKKEFFVKRITDITLFIQKRRDVRLLLSFSLWYQCGRPETTKSLRESINNNDLVFQKIPTQKLRALLDLLNEKISLQHVQPGILEFYNGQDNQISDFQTAQSILITTDLARLMVQIILFLDSPIDPSIDFIEDIFIIPRPFISSNYNATHNSDIWNSSGFEQLSDGAQTIIKLIYNTFGYFAYEFSGVQEHYLRMAATLFWCTRTEPVYSLEIFELLTEMFGNHKLSTRSSQLCDKCNTSTLITCEKKVGSKNRSSIYFRLAPGAEWILTSFFPDPDRKLIIQQQAVALSFLRYSKQILTCPWTINPMNFNYLMDVWFKSFLYSDNLDQIVYEKARELRRNIVRMS